MGSSCSCLADSCCVKYCGDGCCSCCDPYDEYEEESDPESEFEEIPGMPEPGQPPPEAESPFYSPGHVSVFYVNEDPLKGKAVLEEQDLSPVHDIVYQS